MTSSLRLVFAVSLMALVPGAALAQAFATSFSVTFGPGGEASVGSGGSVTMSEITSLSFGSALGTYAVAGSTAGSGSTAAVAGASMEGALAPALRVRPVTGSAANLYETEVFFSETRGFPGYEQNVGSTN